MIDEKDDNQSGEKSVDLDHLQRSLSGNNSDTNRLSQPKIQLLGAAEHDYDSAAVLGFIDDVLTDIPEGAHRLVYTSPTNAPHYPLAGVKELEKIMTRTTAPRAMYYSLTTVYPDPDGSLHHKTENFAGMHGVIFDDIGTKINAADLPEGLEPSYIIESSEGNYQWGFLFDKPITNVEHAKSMIQLIASAKLTDEGGKVPVKLVRLPEGINGKKDSIKQMFHVKLNKWTGLTYTPEQIVERIGLTDESGDITWDRVMDGYDSVAKKHNTKLLPILPQGQSSEGTVDEVLEWLYQEGAVVSTSSGGWVDIVCPWHHNHSTGEITAGYKPLGYGSEPYKRGFNCFHEGCAGKKSNDFFIYIINSSNINAIAFSVLEQLQFGEYVYDRSANEVVKLVSPPVSYPLTSMRTAMKRASSPAVDGQGNVKMLNPVDSWLDSPFRITVDGIGANPGAPHVFDDARGTWLNTCVLPEWGEGAYDQAHVDRFLGYVNYILPSVTEAAYFLDWLTHKMVDPRFRGTGIVMVAKEFGVGRSTLAKMVTAMLGSANCTGVDFSELTGSNFNAWEDKLFVVVNEAEDNSQFSAKHSAYEVLKQRVDTTVTSTVLNPKYGRQREITVCTSYLILSNHINAVAVPRNDRRLTVLTNAEVPESDQYFIELNHWRKNTDWAGHVFRYLTQRKTTNTCLTPLPTRAKDNMAMASESNIDHCVRLLAEHLAEEGIIAMGSKQATHIIAQLMDHGNPDASTSRRHISMRLNKVSERFDYFQVKINGGPETPRMFVNLGSLHDEGAGMLAAKAADIPLSVRDKIRDACVFADTQEILTLLLAQL
tara:strand:+ start:2094 stop:4562 length:2469 start_codon:yes stop_codon:yes gene_type:complete